MPSPLLFKAHPTGRTIVEVTPASAGWCYVGFRALRLEHGEAEVVDTDTRELCVVVLGGCIDATVDGIRHAGLGERTDVFDDLPPAALYVPPGCRVELVARGPAEVALCTAPGDERVRRPQRLDPAAMRHSVRGVGTNSRRVCDILPADDPCAAHLLVVEVRTPPSHSSSYPPHKHDVDAPPDETRLEETYYHRLAPPQGFALQRVYTDDRTLDEACAAENHDVVIVPRGYHPVVVPHGYASYYLNVMAGPVRRWAIRNDPAHAWLLNPPAPPPSPA